MLLLLIAGLGTPAPDRLGANPATWTPSPSVLGADSATWAPGDLDKNFTAGRRSLASEGCTNCCYKNDCSLAFSQTSPGVCCGAHRARGQIGCCPMGASCVACANLWKCTRSSYVTRSSRCRICSDDVPSECLYRSYHGYGHSSASMLPGLILMVGLCAIGMCLFYGGRGEPDVVVVQQPAYGQQVMGPNGQVMMAQGGGMYGGGMYGGGCEYRRSNLDLPCSTPLAPKPRALVMA